MYAVILCFDQQVEAAVRAIWRELADKQISNYAAQVRERKPHITLASFDGLENVSDLVSDLEKFCKEISRFAVTFSSMQKKSCQQPLPCVKTKQNWRDELSKFS
ncbi:Uncharacterised protein [Chlamydia trachomatis]|nr:Uncharacterised protein [Chlamydia trachomatis]